MILDGVFLARYELKVLLVSTGAQPSEHAVVPLRATKAVSNAGKLGW